MKKILLVSVVLFLCVIKGSGQGLPAGCCPTVDPLTHTVLLPNFSDCSTFYSCSNGVPILIPCPGGLHFNDMLKVCDWPENAKCTKGNGANCSSDNDPYCYSGGKGSSQCSIDAGINLGPIGVSLGCGVTCNPGYYACCSLTCRCYKG